jgi:hypothetical protein
VRITTLKVKNFRALTDIEVTFSPTCNVVVGPNAIGKTTLLDAVRLAKALLAARTQSESNQVLLALGALSPHNMTSLFSRALVSDPGVPLMIHCAFDFTAEQLALLEAPASLVAMALQLILANMGRQFSAQTDLIGFLSSPIGREQQEAALNLLKSELPKIKNKTRKCALELLCRVIEQCLKPLVVWSKLEGGTHLRQTK